MLGRFVKKGEKGIMILAPNRPAKKPKATSKTRRTNHQRLSVSRAAYVFDISQTDGQELPTIGSVNGEPRFSTVSALRSLSPSKASL